ncbi:nickel transporter [Vibrio sp. HA2012]|uniref:transporter substrate-binding domain-containing protein n=1 Tax=Vibrio sp. HA2012 TaxID=1971595 RepID=UPI000C2C2FFF|nr:transporter substrate-binding domain-containing protein [Vibrio sp. HA2012]PJC88104.1 nickel transporter [Vibrio sp. HA2012]
MKKWLLAVTLAATAVTGAAQAKDWKVVRFGIEGAYPPFSKTEADGSLSGFDVDMANALCEELKAQCKIVPQDWDGIIPSLLARKYDAIIAAMDINEERKKKVDFTEKYAQLPSKFIAKKGSGLEITAEGLKGKKIGVQRETTHDKYLTDKYGDSLEIVRYGSFDDAFLDLENGRIIGVMGDVPALEAGVINKVGGDAYEFVGPVTWLGEGMGIAVRKQDQDLRNNLSKAIKALRKSGKYQEIAAKYFAFEVYGD